MSKNLSKSKILSGLQCKKRLWLEVHRNDLAEVTVSTEHRFKVGHEVNDVARSFYPDGVLIETENDMGEALFRTKQLLNENKERPVFEATFEHEGVLVRTDILQKIRTGYHVTEVKSSTSVKEYYYSDCAVQAWVLEGAGLPLKKTELAYINNGYIYPGGSNYDGLFSQDDLTKNIKILKKEVPKWVSDFKEVLDGKEPNIVTGSHCSNPYPCPFIGYCSDDGPEYPISCLPGRKKIVEELKAEGINDIRDIPLGRLRNEIQERVRRITEKGEAELDPKARKILDNLDYPRYFLDFETVQFAVPIWKGTRPYENIPFQWSCHIQSKTGELQHEGFLDTSGESPMRALTEKLIKILGKRGPIFVYTSFEKTCLNLLSNHLSDLSSDLQSIIERLIDLHPITKEYYYHPDMLGSWSIKAVLPTIAPHLDYSELGEVQDGIAAGIAYLEMINKNTNKQRKTVLEDNLISYCQHDTLAMVELVRYLESG